VPAEARQRLAQLSSEHRDRWGADLVLACACAHGVPAAIDLFEQRFIRAVPRIVRSLELQGADIDDLQQALRVHVLTGEKPRIGLYAGIGPLDGWFHMTALRFALRRHRKPQARARAEQTMDLAQPLLSAPTQHMLGVLAGDRARLEAALERALTGLSARDKTLLRLNLLDDLGIDAIGRLYCVHRATAARWLAVIRRRIFESVRDELAPDVRLPTADLVSLVYHLRSQVEISLVSALATDPEQGAPA
jgi:RNA polymerase sigma-70 factor, ECF subfamily